MKEYISKEEALEVVRQAYQCYLPQAHGAIMLIENGIANLKPADVREIVRGMWIPSRKHVWKKDKNCKPDEWAWEHEFHNGVYCTLCYTHRCVHCEPDWEMLEDCREEHYVCSRCGEVSLRKTSNCICGAKMDEE